MILKKYVNAIAMSVPFDGTNCPSSSTDAGCYNLAVSESDEEGYADFEAYDAYREYRNGFWYGTVECIPDYIHYSDSGSVSLYRTGKTGENITLSSDEIVSGEVSNTFAAGGALRHELSSAELKEFIDFFDIKEGERENIFEKAMEYLLFLIYGKHISAYGKELFPAEYSLI